jgi:hypothetical protein
MTLADLHVGLDTPERQPFDLQILGRRKAPDTSISDLDDGWRILLFAGDRKAVG